jgi:hypothetical protein
MLQCSIAGAWCTVATGATAVKKPEYKKPTRKAIPLSHRKVKVHVSLPWWMLNAIQKDAAIDGRTVSNWIVRKIGHLPEIIGADPGNTHNILEVTRNSPG